MRIPTSQAGGRCRSPLFRDSESHSVVLRDLDTGQWLQSVVARPAYDGNRSLLVVPDPEADASATKTRFVENWYEQFRDREQD